MLSPSPSYERAPDAETVRLTGSPRASDDLAIGLAWTAHELRGPLVGARAQLERALRGDVDVHGLRRAEAAISELIAGLDALLLFPAGAEGLRRRRTDLVGVTRSAVAQCELELGEGRIVVHAPLRATVYADPIHLQCAIANVVRNALSYSDPGDKVEVVVERTNETAAVTVVDNGPGFPAEDVVRLFDPFMRGERGRERRRGAGLGLFVAGRVIDGHGGRIDVSHSDGHTVVELHIPVGSTRASG